jgi:hypothetical protein
VAAQLRGAASRVVAWAGHSVEVLMRVYARCVTGMEDVWITRMDKTLHPEENQLNSGTYWGQSPSLDGIRWHPASGARPPAFQQTSRSRLALIMVSAPSRIRTCAHGSGGRCSIP